MYYDNYFSPIIELLPQVPASINKPNIRNNLPPGFIFCDPKLGFAHSSFKVPKEIAILFHCTNLDECFCTLYLLTVANLFDPTLPLELYFISIKKHLKEEWYFLDSVILSSDGSSAIKFLIDDPAHERSSESLEEMNRTVKRIVPEMFRSNGVPSIQPLLCLAKYTWYV